MPVIIDSGDEEGFNVYLGFSAWSANISARTYYQSTVLDQKSSWSKMMWSSKGQVSNLLILLSANAI